MQKKPRQIRVFENITIESCQGNSKYRTSKYRLSREKEQRRTALLVLLLIITMIVSIALISPSEMALLEAGII